MDFTMVAPVNQCQVGAVATVYGGLVSLDEQARRAGTISYELLAAIGARVERRYDRGTGSS
jgi:alanine racemase